MSEQLWRKETHFHVVEIQVGPTWVEQHRTQDGEEEAERLARAALEDRSVAAVRVHEHVIIHICSETFADTGRVEMAKESKLRPAGSAARCPACDASAQIYYDGSTNWTSCAACGKTLPMRIHG